MASLKRCASRPISFLMAAIAAIRQRLHSTAGRESGMALPTALFAMIAGLALATAAILSSVDVQQGTHRDRDSKEAIAAADAGANVALLRLNRFQYSLDETHPCVGPAGESLAESSEYPGWCPATASEGVGEATYSYRISAYDTSGVLTVVSTGTSGTVTRRVEVGLFSSRGKEVFAEEKVIGEADIEMEGTPDIRTDVGTNGSIHGNGTPTICGNARHGVGGEAFEPDCEGEVKEGEQKLPPFEPPEGLESTNSNCRLELTCPNASEVDTYSKKRTSTNPWNATKRTINVAQNAQLTLGGTDYFVCGLFVNNGEVIMAAGTTVRIFVDTPENCGLEPGATQVEITGNAKVVSTAYNPDQGTYDVPGIYVLGESTVKMNGNSGTNEFTLYSPYSDIEIGGSATWKGMFAGRTIHMHGTPKIEADPNIPQPEVHYSSLLSRTRYVECTGGTGSTPDAEC